MGLFDNYRLNRAQKRIDRAQANLDAFQGGTSATDLAKRSKLEEELNRHIADQQFLQNRIADRQARRQEADYQRAQEMNNRWTQGDRNFTREDIKWAQGVLKQHAMNQQPEVETEPNFQSEFNLSTPTINTPKMDWVASNPDMLKSEPMVDELNQSINNRYSDDLSFGDNYNIARNFYHDPIFTYNGKQYGTKGWTDFLTKNMSEEELKN